MIVHPFLDCLELFFGKCQFLDFDVILGKIGNVFIIPVGYLQNLIFRSTTTRILF